MADQLKSNHPLILYLTLSLLISTSIADLSLRNLETAISALRANDFDLFGNSIAVSDLSIQILSHNFNSTSINGVGRHGFTFLAPPNSVLFSLDMSTDAFTYVHSLRFHVVPRRLSSSELRNISLSSEPYLETLVPGHVLFVTSSGRRFVSIDGVRVSSPDLYLRSDVAVHGLDGILVSSNEEFYHRLDSVFAPPIPAPETGFKSVSVPSIHAFSPQIVGFPAFSPTFEEIPAPIDAYSPGFIDAISLPPEYEGVPANMSPIVPSSSEFDLIPASHDVAFTGGSFNAISVPPIDAFFPDDEEILTPSPSMEFLSPTEYSYPPVYADWTHSDFLAPDIWSTIWSDPAPPPQLTVGEWQENWEKVSRKKQKKEKKTKKKHHKHGEEHTKLKEHESQGNENGWKTWET